MNQSGAVNRAGCDIHYWLGGADGAPTVVLIHGFALDHRMFDGQLEALASQYRVLRIDVRGHGLSRPMGSAFSVPIAAEDLAVVMDYLQIGSAVLVGHSMGGLIAQQLGCVAAQRVTAFVLVSSFCLTLRQSLKTRLALWLSRQLMSLLPMAVLLERLQRRISRVPATQSYAAAAASVITKEDLVAMWEAVCNSLRPDNDYKAPYPLLLIAGEEDHIAPMRGVYAEWVRRDASAQCHFISGAGHNPNQDQVQDFNRVLLELLASLGA